MTRRIDASQQNSAIKRLHNGAVTREKLRITRAVQLGDVEVQGPEPQWRIPSWHAERFAHAIEHGAAVGQSIVEFWHDEIPPQWMTHGQSGGQLIVVL